MNKDKDYVNTIIVEAEEQTMLLPQATPNASSQFLLELLNVVPPDATRMIPAPMASVQRFAHIGMTVNSVPASCVLSLVAHTGRSETVKLDGGHKLIAGTAGTYHSTRRKKDRKVLQSTLI